MISDGFAEVQGTTMILGGKFQPSLPNATITESDAFDRMLTIASGPGSHYGDPNWTGQFGDVLSRGNMLFRTSFQIKQQYAHSISNFLFINPVHSFSVHNLRRRFASCLSSCY